MKKEEFKEYRKTATVKAKLFEKGDEDGMINPDGMIGIMEDHKYSIQPDLVPFISTLENQHHIGAFGKHYLCIGINNEKWLVEKDIFEQTYELCDAFLSSRPEEKEEDNEEDLRKEEFLHDEQWHENMNSLYHYDDGGFCDGFTR